MIVTALLFGVGAVLSVLAQVGLSHVMSPGGYGDFALLYAAGMVLSGVGALGYDMAALRFMASQASLGDLEARRAFFRMAIRRTAWGAGFLALVAPPICIVAGFLPPLQATALLLLIPAWAGLRLIAAVLRTENQPGASIALDRIARDGSLMVLAAAQFLLASSAGDFWPTVVLVAVTALSALAGAWLVRPLFQRPVLPTPGTEASLWFLASRRLLAINGLELLSGRLDLFLLAFIVEKAVVGQMNIVLVLSTIAVLPSVFTGFILMPRIAAASAKGRQEDIAREIRLSAWLNVLSAVVVSVTVVTGIHLFRNAPGMEPMAAIPLDVIAWIFAARVVTSFVQASVANLQMIGRERVVICAHLSSLSLKGALYGLLAPAVDLGVAVLFCFASAVVFAMVVHLGSRPLGRKAHRADGSPSA